MNKIVNWTLGSFFRTLGRILVYIILGILLSYLIKDIKLPKINLFQVLDVYANYEMGDVIANTTVAMNNATISTTQKQYFGANSSINLHIKSENVWNPANNDIDYQYGYISLCASSDFTPRNFTSGYSSKNARFFNSYQPCQVANSNYSSAYIYYITWQINTTRVCISGATNTYCSLDNNYDFKVDKAMEFSLVDFGLSDKQIEVNTSNGVIINQNQTIINSMGNLTTSINNTENAVNYNGEQQRLNDDKNTNKIINSVTDDNPPDNLNALSNSAGWLPAGPVDSILNLPLNFLNSLFNNLSKTCTPVKLPLPYVNKELELPCVNSLYAQIDGVPTWINTTVGLIASAFILFSYLLKLYKYIDDTLTFRENNFIDNWSGV